ncbi:MAG: hypothetical protein M3R70_04000 [Actinomycetota bacterium]|nr:hypothetical protein [Actinomycetota bacterium]
MTATLADLYLQLEAEMDELHDGAALAAGVRAVLGQLPDGPVMLVSTSDQGAGLAAACAAQRGEPTLWRKVNLRLPFPSPASHSLVIVDPVEGGAGWRRAVERAYPGARLIVLAELNVDVPVAA